MSSLVTPCAAENSTKVPTKIPTKIMGYALSKVTVTSERRWKVGFT